MDAIAIVGIDCRFPGAADPSALWQMLMQGEEGIGEIPPDRWPAEGFHAVGGGAGKTNTRRGGFIENAGAFDHAFFSISPREAAAMDPQQRLMLQTAWRAFEDATLNPAGQAGSRTGVFIGVMGNEWAQLHMADYPNIIPPTGTGNGYCMIANRVSYQFDFKGPSMAVDTACSSSLVAAQLACAALRARECDQALVGGVNVILTPALHIFYSQAGLSAEDGRCRPFSSEANGIGRSEGVGALVLRRLDDALKDGLPIYALIRGGAVNHDGRSNGLTAPNRWSQRDVIAQAYAHAGVEPGSVHFIEAHGTGTLLGDMIEVNALGDVHAVPRQRPCAIGSIKGNLGHTEGAAGIAGLIKVALALHNGVVPASRHADKENDKLALASKGLRLLKASERLPQGEVVAAASSFGLGGTNAHLVLSSPPRTTLRVASVMPAILTVAAPDAEGLRRNVAQLANDVDAELPTRLDAVAWTSNVVKSSGRHRFALVIRNKAHASKALHDALADETSFSALSAVASAGNAGWLFSGQGTQYRGMSHALHKACAVYRRQLEAVELAFAPHLDVSLLDILFKSEHALEQARYVQPALFAVGYAIGKTLWEAGLRPRWLLGHSIGEYAVAVLAGVLELEDACRLVAERGRLTDTLAKGGMLAVHAGAEQLKPFIEAFGDACIAAINAPDRIVLSGQGASLDQIADRLQAQGIAHRRLPVTHAFHSSLMEPMRERFASVASGIVYRPCMLPVYSTLYGRLLGNDMMDAGYWVEHAMQPVLFMQAAQAALADAPAHLVEIGPRRVLGALMDRLPTRGSGQMFWPCPGEQAHGDEVLETIAGLYRHGAEIRWDVIYGGEPVLRRRLKPYVFATDMRFWKHGDAMHPHQGATPGASVQAVPPKEPSRKANRVLEGSDPLEAELKAIVADLGGYAHDRIPDHARLYEDLGYDSITAMQLKEKVEQRWNLQIKVEQLFSELHTVADLVALLRRAVAEPA